MTIVNPYVFTAPFKPTSLSSKLKFWYSAEYQKGFTADNALPNPVKDIAGLLDGVGASSLTLQYTGGDGGAACFRFPGSGTNAITFGSGVYFGAISAADGYELMFYGKQDAGTTASGNTVVSSTGAGGFEHCTWSDGNWYENFFRNVRDSWTPVVNRTNYQPWDFWSKTNDWGVRLGTTDERLANPSTYSAPAGGVSIGSGYSPAALRIGGICGFSPILTNAERTQMRAFFAANPGGGLP